MNTLTTTKNIFIFIIIVVVIFFSSFLVLINKELPFSNQKANALK